MPPLNEISSLNEYAQCFALDWFSKCINAITSPLKRDQQRKYICTILNSDIRQTLLSKVLSKPIYTLDMTAKCHFIVLLADNSTRAINLSGECGIFIDEVFHLYHALTVSSLTALQSLKIKCDIKGKRDEKYILEVNSTFYKSLENMTRLRQLTLISIGDTALLGVVGENCTHLEYIDVSNSNHINDESISALLLEDAFDISSASLSDIVKYSGRLRPCCCKLKFLGISNTEVSSKSILLAVTVLPQLASFGGYITGGSLCNVLNTFKEKGCPKLNLTHLWEFTLNSIHSALIKEICPNLELLSIGAHSLASICNFDALRELVIECDFGQFSNEIVDALYECGKHLHILELNESLICRLDLASLVEYTPQLRELKAPLAYNDGNDVPSWEHLRKAEIVISSSHCMRSFLSCCTFLEHLTIHFVAAPYRETANCIDDDLLTDILTKGGLHSLEYLYLEDCALSEVSMESLLIHCPRLSCVQKLIYWKNLRHDYIKELKGKIVKLNWKLKIILKEEFFDLSL